MPTNHRPPMYQARPNHTTACPRKLLFFDTETDQVLLNKSGSHWANKFRLMVAIYVRLEGGVVTRRRILRTKSTQEFWDFLLKLQSPYRPVWAFAHNLLFDLRIAGFWDRLTMGDYTRGPVAGGGKDPRVKGKRAWLGKYVMEGRPCYAYLMGKKGRVNFVDSMNYFPKALAKLGEELHFPKGELPAFGAPEKELFEYCQRDVEILEKAIVGGMQDWLKADCGYWQPTAPMLAMQALMHERGEGKPGGEWHDLVFEDDEAAIHLERQTYYGGRFEAFYHGKIHETLPKRKLFDYAGDLKDIPHETGPIYHLDINGLYSMCMRDGLFPWKRKEKRNQPTVEWLTAQTAVHGACAVVLIESLERPYMVRTNKGNVLATGIFQTALAGPELRRALLAGDVRKVFACITYYTCPFFSKWIELWYKRLQQARKSNEPIKAGFAKLIMNSLTGKFAQKGMRWVERPEIVPVKSWGSWYSCPYPLDDPPADPPPMRKFRAFNREVQECIDQGIPRNCFPAISAFITSYGREHMRHLISLCPPRSVFYQGCDSLIVTQAAFDVLGAARQLSEIELGKLKVLRTAAEGEIVGVNLYRVGEHLVRSGTFAKAKEIKPGVWEYESWEDQVSALKVKPDDLVRVSKIRVKACEPVPKGTVGKDGWTSPFHLVDEAIDWNDYCWRKR